MHSLQFTYKIKKRCWPHMGPFFVVCLKKRNNLFLKFSIKIHICIIIHFKAIREEWERSKESCSTSPLFCLPEWNWRETAGAFTWERSWGATAALGFCTPLIWCGEEKRRIYIYIYERINERRHCRFPCLATNSFKETKNRFIFLKKPSSSPFQKTSYFLV